MIRIAFKVAVAMHSRRPSLGDPFSGAPPLTAASPFDGDLTGFGGDLVRLVCVGGD